MDINDLNRRVRYAFSLDDADVLSALQLARYEAPAESVTAWRLKEGDAGFQPCPAGALYALLDGLIVQRRGAREPSQANQRDTEATTAEATIEANTKSPEDTIDNNEVLKRLRIALSLKTDEVGDLITQGGGKLGRSEVNALFRKPSARNYRRCGDQVLRWFLSGLAKNRQSFTDQ